MMPTPLEIRLRREQKQVEIVFDDGATFTLPAEYLRVESPSAEVQGHGPGERRKYVRLLRVSPLR